MLSPLRTRAGRRLREPFGKAGLTVAVIALVFAMLGGAYAASKLTSKQKKEVEKIAKKFQGTGPAGSQGPAGANGKDGANGTNGKDGLNGKDGTNGTNGTDGTDGTDGNSITSSPVLVGDPACGGRGGAIYEIEDVVGSETEICNGSVGQDAGFNYTFNSAVAEADPGSGKLALNNTAPGSATVLSVSETDANSNGLAAVIQKWTTGFGAQGTLLIRKAGSPGTFAEFTVKGGFVCTPTQKTNTPGECGMVDEGSFDNVNVSFVAGNGTLAAGGPVTVAYWSAAAETLPPGAVETGVFAASRSVEEIETEVAGTVHHEVIGDSIVIAVPIALPIPLVANIEGTHVHVLGDADFTTFCELNASRPKPKNSGEICIYLETEGTKFMGVGSPGSTVHGTEGRTIARSGAVLYFTKPTADAIISGGFGVRG